MRSIVGKLCVGLAFLPVAPLHAAVNCELTNFSVETYHHTGVYLHGVMAGQGAQWIVICGTNTANQQDCNSKATDRNLAVALAAQAQGKSLWIYFESLNSCTSFPNYTQATALKLTP
jgi:hypothetical protein